MLNMQDFYEWLSATSINQDTHQHRLARLAHTDRTRILNATGENQWFLWEEKPAEFAK